MEENVNEKAEQREDASVKEMDGMMENVAHTTAMVIVSMIKDKKDVDLSDMMADIQKGIKTGIVMSLMIPIMCH